MHERDVWTAVVAFLAAVMAATTDLGGAFLLVALGLVLGSWLVDRRHGLDGEAAILGPLAVALAYLVVIETPPQQMFLNGLVRSGILAIGAVGLSLVYGILNLVNFAHGDLLTTGGYFAWLVVTPAFGVAPWHVGLALLVPLLGFLAWDLLAGQFSADRAAPVLVGSSAIAIVSVFALPNGFWIGVGSFALGLAGWNRLRSTPMQPADRWTMAGGGACIGVAIGLSYALGSLWAQVAGSLIVAGATVAVLSIGLDRVLWTRLRDRDANLLTLMIVSIGVAFALRSGLQIAFGGDVRTFLQAAGAPSYTASYWLSLVGPDLRVTRMDVWIIVSSAVAIAFTTYVTQRTRVGKAMRALADNKDLARVAGIDTERVILYVWLLGGALAGIAGALLAMETSLSNVLGWRALPPLFAVVILGGVGSVPGAMLGGLVIGMAEALSVHWLSLTDLDTSYNVAVGFLLLIVTLVIRPQGIMGVDRS
jgi:branched-subunit amino acid ABC-type transport system permease component